MELKEIKDFKKEELEELFLSVEWESGKYPEKLVEAMKNSSTVVSAWNDGKLIGLMTALSDTMNVYFHYLLVRPEYQGKGIGKKIVKRMFDLYDDHARKILISMGEKVGFYENCGFTAGADKMPMFDTYLEG